MLMLDFSPHIWLCGLYVAHYSYTVGSNISTRHASEEANNYIHRIIKYRYQICGFLYFPDFREFVTALSIHRKGTFDERILWVFNLYDSDGNGRITKSELTDMVTVCIQCILLLCVESILVTLAVTGIPKRKWKHFMFFWSNVISALKGKGTPWTDIYKMCSDFSFNIS